MLLFVTAQACGNVVIDAAPSGSGGSTATTSTISTATTLCYCACTGVCATSCTAGSPYDLDALPTDLCNGGTVGPECMNCLRLACGVGPPPGLPVPTCP